jgi:hypothetical protein
MPPHFRVLSHSDTPNSGRDLYLTTRNTHKRQTSMLPAGFEPTIQTSERPQTHTFRPRGSLVGETIWVHKPSSCVSKRLWRAIRLTVLYAGNSVTWHAAGAREREYSTCWREDIPTFCCYLLKKWTLAVPCAAVESTKHSACVKTVYSCSFADLFILTLWDLVIILFTVRFNIQQFHVLPTQCIYVFCVDLRTNNDHFPIQH